MCTLYEISSLDVLNDRGSIACPEPTVRKPVGANASYTKKN